MKKIVRLTESDLTRLVKRSVNELRDMADKYESGWKPTGPKKSEEMTSYDLEGEDFSELDKPAFGADYHMVMRKTVRDIKRNLDTIISNKGFHRGTIEMLLKIDDMLKNR